MRHPVKSHFLLILISVFGGVAIRAQQLVERQIVSSVYKKNVNLVVHLPDGYQASPKKYSVLCIIHGNEKMVTEVATLCRDLNQKKVAPDMIVAGVDIEDENLDRMRDAETYDKFLSCLERELMPAINNTYRTDGRSILYEKSLFGSFALYSFLTRPTLFDGYIAASKQWYEDNNSYFTELADKSLSNPNAFKGKKLFLATLNGAYNNNNIPEVNKQMQAFSSRLSSKSGKRISAKYQAFDDWGITPQPGFTEGLLFVNSKGKTPRSTPLSMAQTAEGKWVIMDKQSNVVYDVFIYDNGPDYPSEGLIRVVKNGKIGYANAKTYAIAIEPQFDCAFPFEKGKAKVSNHCKTVKNGEYSLWESNDWKYVDKKGSVTNN